MIIRRAIIQVGVVTEEQSPQQNDDGPIKQDKEAMAMTTQNTQNNNNNNNNNNNSNNNNNNNKNKKKKQVSFHHVQIRRYPMIVGDHPSCRMGAPVMLDWSYEELPWLDLDDYEETRQHQRRTKMQQLVLSYYRRQQILLESNGISLEEWKQAERNVSNIQWQRWRTTALLPFSKVEDGIQSAKRKIKRKFVSSS